jgi:hypothetical protein
MAYFIHQPHLTNLPLNHHLFGKKKWNLIPRGPILSLLSFSITKYFTLFLDIIKLPPLITPSSGQAHGRPAMTIEQVILPPIA